MSKTIFHPGRAVSSTWLNNSQYLGPSNKGVAFVANPVNDWEYPLLDATSLDLPNFAQYFVSMSGDQDINGVKTFNSIPKFPTSTLLTGQQAVNVDRLNLDLATQNTSLTTQINNLSTTTVASLAALTSNLNTNFVNLAGNQTITGTKTFSNIIVPATPTVANNPISFQYYTNNTVLTAGNQTILGNKNFADITVPLLPTVPKSPVSSQYFTDNAVVDTGDQTIAGIKTFLDPRVPLVPNVVASPVSLQHFNDNAVVDTGNQTIAGIKTFLSSPQVPTGILPGDAVNYAQLLASAIVTGARKIELDGGLTITWGSEVVSNIVTSGGGRSVTYGHTYNVAPFVFCSAYGPGFSVVNMSSHNTTGAVLAGYNAFPSSYGAAAYNWVWVAIGY